MPDHIDEVEDDSDQQAEQEAQLRDRLAKVEEQRSRILEQR